MLSNHLGQLIYLAIVLAPGVVSGAIVARKTRSPWALFITIGFSLLGSIIIAVTTVLLGKLIAPFLVNSIGYWGIVIDFTSQLPESPHSWFGYLPFYLLLLLRYTILAPIGTVAGAALSGMLMLVRYRLLREGGKFDPQYAWTAGFSSAIIGGFLGVFSLLAISWTAWHVLSFTNPILRDLNIDSYYIFWIALIFWGILILINGLICGLISAIGGFKLAKFLM